MSERVTLENFDRAESDRYFGAVVRHGAFGRIEHERRVISVEQQSAPHGNRDTLYSSGVFDLDAAAVTITLPDPGRRFMSLVVIDEHLYTHIDAHSPGSYTFTRAGVGTRYVLVEIRFFVDAGDRGDVDAVHGLQDQVDVRQQWTGQFVVPAWDDTSEKFVREALLALRDTLGEAATALGAPFESDSIHHLVGCAATGGTSDRAALSIAITPDRNDGITTYHLTVGDVPVDGFWSISVYNAAGFFEHNEREAYTVNSITAMRNHDGSITVQFGGCERAGPNCLPITPGWSYLVRLYRPRIEILDHEWQFPVAQPMTSTFQEAVDLVLWGMPIVGAAAMRHAFLRDAGARDNDIVYWSRPADGTTQIPTIHGASRYVLAMFETFHGPVVLEVPPTRGALVGSILDAWQLPVADIGTDGEDRGEGGRFLLLPPTDCGTEVAGTIPVPLRTFSGYALLRAAPDTPLELLRGLRVVPVDDRRALREPQLIDMTGKPFDGLIKFDERFFDELARIVAIEPVPDHDRERIAALGRLDNAESTLLVAAAHAAHELLVRRVGEHGTRVWPARRWRRLPDVEAHQGEPPIARDLVAFRHSAPAAKRPEIGAWLHAFVDQHDETLHGDRAYRLRIPPGSPRWTVTAYDRATCSFIREATAIETRSDAPGLVVEPDGSVVVDFGAHPRAGREANFIDTRVRGSWFVTFLVDVAAAGEWDLPDLELAL